MEATVPLPDIRPRKRETVRNVLVICSKGTLEDVYAALVLANGALMEGRKASLFFTFFGLDALRKDTQDELHTATVGNPSLMRHVPTMVSGLPGFEALVSARLKHEMEKLDIPPVSEFLEIIQASGGQIYACKLAFDLFKLDRADLIDGLDGVLTVGDMYALADEPGTHIVFV